MRADWRKADLAGKTGGMLRKGRDSSDPIGAVKNSESLVALRAEERVDNRCSPTKATVASPGLFAEPADRRRNEAGVDVFHRGEDAEIKNLGKVFDPNFWVVEGRLNGC